jgi:hypothetical protein
VKILSSDGLTPLKPSGSHAFTVGVDTALKICVKNCNREKSLQEHIILKGKLYGGTTITFPPRGPPPANVGGELSLVAESSSGYWHNAFGVPVLHLR